MKIPDIEFLSRYKLTLSLKVTVVDSLNFKSGVCRDSYQNTLLIGMDLNRIVE